MKNHKNNQRAIILSVILIGLLIVAYRVMFMSPVPESLLTGDNVAASEKAVSILQQVESVNFDTTIISDPKFKSLESIEIPLPSLPIGKKNPFSASAN